MPAPPLRHGVEADDAADDGADHVELPNGADPPDESPAAWSDATLVARLRERDERACAELYARFAPLLMDEARRRRVDAASRSEVVMDTITQAAMVLLRSGTPVPGSLTGYLVTSLRRRVVNLVRDAQARARRLDGLAVEMGSTPAGDGGATADPAAPVPRAIAELARILDQHLKDDERQLLAWLGDRVPQREIAEWVGSSYGAVRVRVLRLRERLREVARRHAATLPPDERVLLERYLSAIPPRIPSRPPAARPSPSTGATRAPGGNRHGTST